MSKFEELFVGQVASITHVITAEDIGKFVQLTGDDNRLHVDPVYAANTSFKKPVAHGMLGASFISTIIGTKLPGDGALWYEQNLEFLLPVHEGDTLTVTAEVLKKDDRNRSIELQTDISNQYRQKVTRGRAKVRVVEQIKPLQSTNEEAPRNKVALIIGGTGGIGSAACISLADDGFDIAFTYHKNERAADMLIKKIVDKGQKAKAFKCDITKKDDVANLSEQILRVFSGVTALVNCSTEKITPISYKDLSWGDFQPHLDNQLLGTFNIVKEFSSVMEAQRYGKVVLMSSQALEAPWISLSPYIAAKGALVGFAKSLAFDLAPKGIRVNIISAGMTETDQLVGIPERVLLTAAAKTPLKRLATPQDVANAIVFLASDKSDYLTGETIRVNGGQVMI